MHFLLRQTIMTDAAPVPVLCTLSAAQQRRCLVPDMPRRRSDGGFGREMALRQGEDGLCLYRHVLKTRTQTRLVPAAC